ncbi:hydantoinase/oxoprolinase family protein [Sphingomonas sp. YL-JM2C]
MADRSTYFVGVDVGGTFTDLVIVCSQTGEVRNVKTLTTPTEPVRGVMNAVREALALVGATGAQLDRVVHATTLPTNLVLERKGAKVGFVTTLGFGDMFRISKQKPIGSNRYDLSYRRPEPLVARGMVAEICERMDHLGHVITPLDVADAEARIAALAAKGPEAVAICLMHGYANPDHEQRVAEIARRHMPDAYVCISSDIWPEYQEYERASTAVLSAYIGPTFSGYVNELERALRDLGYARPLQIMQSSGGVMTAAAAARKAAYMIESGPAAGIMASAELGRACGFDNLISFDMGGTTAKAGVVQNGQPRITNDFRVGGKASAGGRDAGEPIKVPVIDLAEVGAGGGSIAWVDRGGFLQLGPESASSEPGPACYGFGGTEMTVTDANLLLGYLDPDYFLGGTMRIHPDRSRAAADRLAAKLGIDATGVARGIHMLANTNMASAIRIVTLQRGIDPREYVLTASGGAGPLHVVGVAEHFGIPTVIIPPSPGVRSAFGLLVADMAYDQIAMAADVSAGDFAALDAQFAQLEAEGRAQLRRDGFEEGIVVERAVSIRFESQVLDLTIPIPDGPVDAAVIAAAEASFRELYAATAGLRPTDRCTLVHCKVRVVAHVRKPEQAVHAPCPGDAAQAVKRLRPAYFAAAGGFVDTPVYDRARLAPGDAFAGPAIVEEPESTTICPPGYVVEVDRHLNLVIERNGLEERASIGENLVTCL